MIENNIVIDLTLYKQNIYIHTYTKKIIYLYTNVNIGEIFEKFVRQTRPSYKGQFEMFTLGLSFSLLLDRDWWKSCLRVTPIVKLG